MALTLPFLRVGPPPFVALAAAFVGAGGTVRVAGLGIGGAFAW